MNVEEGVEDRKSEGKPEDSSQIKNEKKTKKKYFQSLGETKTKHTKLRKSSSLIRKLKLVKQASVASLPCGEIRSNFEDPKDTSSPSCSSFDSPIERQTPEGNENELLNKSASDTNLTETSRESEEKQTESASPSKSVIKIESSQHRLSVDHSEKNPKSKGRAKSLETLKGMPAYGDLILDTITMSSHNQIKPKDHLYKILVIGDLGTGKTSIIKRYVHEFFSQHYRATIGVDFALKVLNWDERTRIRLQLWDIAGQERYGNMTRVYYKEAVGAFIVFDVTRINTFESVANWKSDLDSKVHLPDGSPIPCVLLANKCDQPKEGLVNNPAKMDEYCREKGFSAWFETSAKENININEAARALVKEILENDRIINSEAHKDGDRLALDYRNTADSNRRSCAC